MNRPALHLGILLAGALLLATMLAPDNPVAGWISPPVASAAPGFHYLIAPMVTTSVSEMERRGYAEKLQARLEGKLFCDLSYDEYFKCRPDQNTEVVQLTEEVIAGRDTRQLELSVNSRTAMAGHKMKISEYGCSVKVPLGRCVASAIDKFSVALADHRDNCHLPGKTCESK